MPEPASTAAASTESEAPLTRRTARARTAPIVVAAPVTEPLAETGTEGPVDLAVVAPPVEAVIETDPVHAEIVEPAIAFLAAAAEAVAEVEAAPDSAVVLVETVSSAAVFEPAETRVAEVAAQTQPASAVESLPEAAPEFELLEPVDVPAPAEPITEHTLHAEPEASPSFDEFDAAARLFSFTGETPVQHPAAESVVAEEAEVSRESAHIADRGAKVRAPRRQRPGVSFKRVAATSFSMSAMAIAGLLAVGMTTPAAALATSSVEAGVNPASTATALAGDVELDPADIQAYVAPAQVENADLEREGGYSIASLADIAKADGINHTSSLFTNDPTAAIQWPFPVGVPMSFPFGMRWGAMHTGIDLTPGNGAKIQAIADGVVRSASNATGGYGVNIYIDHIIDGKLVTSHYAHMQYGSMRVKTGDHVKVGQIIGVVGNTGHSFGAHLHFEILLNGTQLVDPLPWMRKNAGRQSLD